MERYRKINLKLTPQRMAIFDYLDGNKAHPSAEQIYRGIRKKFPTTSFATVYKTLEALKKKGQIHELTIDESRRRYDPDTNYHHHLICLDCKSIVDVNIDFNITIPDDQKYSYDVIGNHIQFFGVCPKCRDNHDSQK
ncbi:MAG: transcriptional repressor [Nitrospiraceae bacterium]|nr:MAG: transcriptional repressor [Nitrospiraceae bacterium]